jgi:hypothetical protein
MFRRLDDVRLAVLMLDGIELNATRPVAQWREQRFY